jgi:hypothetical protein
MAGPRTPYFNIYHVAAISPAVGATLTIMPSKLATSRADSQTPVNVGSGQNIQNIDKNEPHIHLLDPIVNTNSTGIGHVTCTLYEDRRRHRAYINRVTV